MISRTDPVISFAYSRTRTLKPVMKVLNYKKWIKTCIIQINCIILQHECILNYVRYEKRPIFI